MWPVQWQKIIEYSCIGHGRATVQLPGTHDRLRNALDQITHGKQNKSAADASFAETIADRLKEERVWGTYMKRLNRGDDDDVALLGAREKTQAIMTL